MNNSWNDELISAYVDGELTAEQQAQVEQALASDARLRQMHDDLRALRHSLQALPRVKLDAGFAARVLEAAQKAKAAQAAPLATPVATPIPAPVALLEQTAAAAAAAKHAEHHHLAVVPAHPTEPTSWHVMVWSLFGAAAALLLVLLWPGPMSQVAERFAKTQTTKTQTTEQQIAQVDAAKPGSPNKPDTAKQQAGGEAEEAATFVERHKDRANADEAKALRQSGVDNDQPRFDLRSKEMANDAVRSSDFGNRGENESLKKIPGPQNAIRAQTAPAEEKSRDLRMAQPATKGAMRFGVKGPQADGASEGLEQQADQPNGKEPRGKEANRKETDREASDDRLVESERLVVVRLSVPAEVLKRRGIDATLAKNGIAMSAPEVADAEFAAKKRLPRDEKNEGEAAGNMAADAPVAKGEAGLQSEREGGRALLEVEGLASNEIDRVASGDVDLVYVEASQEQLAKTLLDLQTQPGFRVDLSEANQNAEQPPAGAEPSGEGQAQGGNSPLASPTGRGRNAFGGGGGLGGAGLGGVGGGGLGGFGDAKSMAAPAAPVPPPAIAGPASAAAPEAAAPAAPEGAPGAGAGGGFAPLAQGTPASEKKASEPKPVELQKPGARGGGLPAPARALAGDDVQSRDKQKADANPLVMSDELQIKDDRADRRQGFARRVPVDAFRRQAEEPRRADASPSKLAANGAAAPPAPFVPPGPPPAIRGAAEAPQSATLQGDVEGTKRAEAGKKVADSKAGGEAGGRVRVLFVIEAKE